MLKLTIGMASYDAFRDVWFTVQALRLSHRAAREAEILLVDNHPGPLLEIEGERRPTSPHGTTLFSFVRSLNDPMVRYIPLPDPIGTSAPRQRVFDEATGDVVLCMDSHVVLDALRDPQPLDALLSHFEQPGTERDLVSGPMLYDGFVGNPSMFLDQWRGGMRGVWASAWFCRCRKQVFASRNDREELLLVDARAPHQPRSHCPFCHLTLPKVPWHGHEKQLRAAGMGEVGTDSSLPPFEVEGQGLGAFACRRETWKAVGGFNREFRGFGGEELYIHEKIRRSGGRNICLPAFRWNHCFGNPDGNRYPASVWNKVRNYVIGHRELGMSLDLVHKHFVEDKVKDNILTEEQWRLLVSTDPPHPEQLPPQSGCQNCSKPPIPDSLEAWYELVKTERSDFFEHVPVLRELASKCESATEFGTRHCVSTVALVAAQIPKVISYDINPSWQAGKLKELEGKTNFQFRLGDSRSSNIEETDLLFVDTVHTAQHVLDELTNAAHKVRKYIAFHDTEAPFGERGEDGGPGVLAAVRAFVWQRPEWTVKEHRRNCHGLTILSRLPEDRKALPGKLKQAWNFAKAQTRHALNGGKYLPLPLIEERAKHCALCPQRSGESCSVCGCPLRQVPDDAPAKAGQPGKLAYPMEFCPLGHWGQLPDKGIDMTPEQVKELLHQLGESDGS